MKIQFPQQQLDQYDNYAFYENAFTVDECEKLKKEFYNLSDGLIGGDTKAHHNIRKSKIKFIEPNLENEWVYQKFYAISKQCNDVRWKFQLSGFNDGIQLTQYDGDGSHYDWHMDNGNAEFSLRKLSIILILDEKNQYDGGELGFIGIPEKVKYDIGTVIVFPSFVGHKVYPVTKGKRRTAVAWICGEPYR